MPKTWAHSDKKEWTLPSIRKIEMLMQLQTISGIKFNRILAIGPGFSELPALLQNYFGHVECWEISPEAVQFQQSKGVECLQRDIFEIDLSTMDPSESYDLVIDDSFIDVFIANGGVRKVYSIVNQIPSKVLITFSFHISSWKCVVTRKLGAENVLFGTVVNHLENRLSQRPTGMRRDIAVIVKFNVDIAASREVVHEYFCRMIAKQNHESGKEGLCGWFTNVNRNDMCYGGERYS